jgi:hypothetical protein
LWSKISIPERKMGKNYEKEFFEQFESSSPKEQPLEPLSELFGTDSEHDELEELGELILRFQDGDINQTQFTRMQDWLLNDRKARDYYINFVFLCEGLKSVLNNKHDIISLQSLLASKA